MTEPGGRAVTGTRQRKHLVLHIEIPGFYADDLDDSAAMYSEPEPPGPQERLDVVTEEWMREKVGITLVSLPGEKCMNDDFEVHAYTGRIVGAETRDAPHGPAWAQDAKGETVIRASAPMIAADQIS